ncbi:peptidoglycan DD-metalloendopeptidase family protein [Loktanella sp. SALINAS62]|uniref:murein hydrolase activator EnvC family protein n=1 Tax=Loktanella sp. SALINAS62 TaxID=2706124 RepID=UPI001B8AF522|nr:peptidoglycan DD-metalloendopeptidase family protein [Loktanella sp. SALINAS62]MBS1302389.1 peptidoglycan DD-metalloendopeptidase family protein [Loktanella sp. SALINAS62]
MRTLVLILMLWGGIAAAQSPAEAAQQAADRLTAARAQLDAAGSGSDRVTALSETVGAYEDGLIALRDGLRRLAIQQDTMQTQLDSRSVEVGRLLGVLASIGDAPAPLLLLHPNGALGTARAGMIVADVTPALQSQVDELRLQLEELGLIQSLQETALDTLGDGLEGAQAARAALSAAISDRTDLPRRFSDDPIQTALLLASTDTLDDFADGLAQFFDTGDAAPTLEPTGNLPSPVRGTVLRGFNLPDAAGISRPGVIIAGRPRALVTTPVAATVLFRGPLLDYGNVIIIEPAQDVMMVLGGLAEVYGETGQVLPAGAPVGLLGGDAPAIDDILTETKRSSDPAASETLYLEVREGQSPVDPATWFALDQR